MAARRHDAHRGTHRCAHDHHPRSAAVAQVGHDRTDVLEVGLLRSAGTRRRSRQSRTPPRGSPCWRAAWRTATTGTCSRHSGARAPRPSGRSRNRPRQGWRPRRSPGEASGPAWPAPGSPFPTGGSDAPGEAEPDPVASGGGTGPVGSSAHPAPTASTSAPTAASSVLARRDMRHSVTTRFGGYRERLAGVREARGRQRAPAAGPARAARCPTSRMRRYPRPGHLGCAGWVGSWVTAETSPGTRTAPARYGVRAPGRASTWARSSNAVSTLDWSDLDRRAVDTVRTLAMDAVEQAGNGHPGTAMSLAPAAYLLFQRVMRHDPSDPSWPGRDRFVLSCGHSSLTLYIQLYLSGYGLQLDDLRAAAPVGLAHPGPSRVRAHGRCGDHDRSARTGAGQRGRHGDGVSAGAGPVRPGRRPQPVRPLHLRDLLRRRHRGGCQPRGELARRPPEAGQPHRDLGRQPDLH